MLEKFVSIKNIGRFKNYSSVGDVAFRKLTLLFAENGLGKTTLCAILRSLQSGQHEWITERKTLGTNNPPILQIRLDGRSFSYASNAWSATYPDITVFDSVFVHDNVYSGDYIDHEHKRNLYRVIVGTQGVKLAQKVDLLNEQIRAVNTDLNSKKNALDRVVPQGTNLNAYLAWRAIPDIELLITQKSNEIANRQRALTRAGEIQARGLLSTLKLPSLPSDFTTILSRQLADIATDAETSVRQQITNHQMRGQGETWLSQGLAYVNNELCPFCGQSVKFNDLIAAYRSHFNTAYKGLKWEVAQLSQRINSTLGDASLNFLQKVHLGNLSLVEFWKQFAEISLAPCPFEDIQITHVKLRELALALAERKQQNPAEAISPDVEYTSTLKDVQLFRQSVEAYNTAVHVINSRIKEQKAAVLQGGRIDSLKAELSQMETQKKRFDPVVVQSCHEYQTAFKAKSNLAEQKKAAKNQLDQYCATILQSYEKNINKYLDQFNAGFRIVNTKHSYTGGTPSSQFQIVINECPVEIGSPKTPVGTPCFRTTLSAGDKSALALAFFLSALEQDPKVSQKIVVLDDPFTSLDRFRRTCTQQIIRQLTHQAKQVIVLSHDSYFLKLLWDGFPTSEIKELQMSKAGETTVIGQWDIESETQSGYIKDYAVLLDYYRERRGVPLSVIRAIRPFIEGHYRSHFPGHFQQDEWLGDFISKVRSADSSSGLQHAKVDLDEIEAINEYSKKYHHQNPYTDSAGSISDDELHGFVRRTLNLVGGLYV